MEVILSDVNEIEWEIWEPKEKAVIVYIRDGENLILIHKKTGLGAGKINAPGGRIEKGETALDAAVRECREEIGVTPLELTHRAELSFVFKDGYSLFGYVFFANGYEGDLIETEEADPFLCNIEKIPYAEMWEDDILWLPHTLEGKFVKGWFIFEDDKMISSKLEISHQDNYQ